MIKDFFVEKENEIIKWMYGNNICQFKADDLEQAMVDEKNDIIYILSGISTFPDKLTILNEEGGEIVILSPPNGAFFYYLTKDHDLQVLIVCSFEEKKDGWHDWHYLFDLTLNKLVRKSPSY